MLCSILSSGVGASTLELRVSVATGEVFIVNPTASAVTIDAYAIDSASNALLPENWLTVAENFDLSGDQSVDAIANWQVLNESSTTLFEASLVTLSGQIDAVSSVNLGAIWTVGAATDLTFEYLAGSTTFSATPIFDLTGDISGDGVVDALDFLAFRDTFGATGPGLAADVNFDGVVSGADFFSVNDQFGAVGASPVLAASAALVAASIPEPSGFAFATTAFAVWLSNRRRRLT